MHDSQTVPPEHARTLKKIMQITSQETLRCAKRIHNEKQSFTSAVDQVMRVHEQALAQYGADPIPPLRRGQMYDFIRAGLHQAVTILQRGGKPGVIIGDPKPLR